MMKQNPSRKLRIGLVVPHIFLHREILPRVIFSPGHLALSLADGLQQLGAEVTLFTPGPVDTNVANITADLSGFEHELASRGDTYTDLLKKHPFTFVTLARQVQAEIIAKAYAMANEDQLDAVHIYTNEEDTALPFARLCAKPVVFTHHDPFNFLIKYKSVFPKYKQLNWLALSDAQRSTMPDNTNWVGTIYHGLNKQQFMPVERPRNDYLAYFGRIIQPKGLHLAISAAKAAGVKLKIAGKHYSGQKDTYWKQVIAPQLSDMVEYVGFINDVKEKQEFLGNAKALLVPSIYNEPFGMVSIEALACGTPVIGLNMGATAEIIRDGHTGYIVPYSTEPATIASLSSAINRLTLISRHACRQEFEARFTLEEMCSKHLAVYRQLINGSTV